MVKLLHRMWSFIFVAFFDHQYWVIILFFLRGSSLRGYKCCKVG
jgi:hypothetical protein